MSHPKPYADYPLHVAGNGQWSKVVNKRRYYFGVAKSDPKGEFALKEWVANRDAIHAGTYSPKTAKDRTEAAEGLSVEQVIKKYLDQRAMDVHHRLLSPDTYRDYTAALAIFQAFVTPTFPATALCPSVFTAWRQSFDGKFGPHHIKKQIASVRACFNYAMDSQWIPVIRFGRAMKSPDTEAEAVAHHHEQNGLTAKTERILKRREFRKLLRATKVRPKERAWVLLMLNSAMNPAEIARLRWSQIDLDTGRLSRRRGKAKGIRLECYLWKITRKTLSALTRPEGQELVFTRPNGLPLVGSRMKDGKPVRWNKLTDRFIKLCKQIGLSGITPYTLRRTARTLAGHCEDDNAARRMMGQRLSGRDQTYLKQPFPLWRLRRIALTILRRLLPPKPPHPGLRIADDKAA